MKFIIEHLGWAGLSIVVMVTILIGLFQWFAWRMYFRFKKNETQ